MVFRLYYREIPNLPWNSGGILFRVSVNLILFKVFDDADSKLNGLNFISILDFRFTAKIPILPGNSWRNYLFGISVNLISFKVFDDADSEFYGFHFSPIIVFPYDHGYGFLIPNFL